MTKRETITLDKAIFDTALRILGVDTDTPPTHLEIGYIAGGLRAAAVLTPQDERSDMNPKEVAQLLKDRDSWRREAKEYAAAVERSGCYVDKKYDGLLYVFSRDSPLPHQRVDLE